MAESNEPDTGEKILAGLRAEIDEVDKGLLALLKKRFALASKVAASKQQGTVFRPGREADLIRRLMAENALEPLMVESIWRQIIALSLYTQKRLRIALTSGESVDRTARFRFGMVGDYDPLGDADAVLEAVAEGKADIGVLPHWGQGGWWRGLAERRGRGERVYIVSTAPMLTSLGLDPVALLAQELPYPSGNDITLVHGAAGVEEKPGHDPAAPNLLGIVQQL